MGFNVRVKVVLGEPKQTDEITFFADTSKLEDVPALIDGYIKHLYFSPVDFVVPLSIEYNSLTVLRMDDLEPVDGR